MARPHIPLAAALALCAAVACGERKEPPPAAQPPRAEVAPAPAPAAPTAETSAAEPRAAPAPAAEAAAEQPKPVEGTAKAKAAPPPRAVAETAAASPKPSGAAPSSAPRAESTPPAAQPAAPAIASPAAPAPPAAEAPAAAPVGAHAKVGADKCKMCHRVQHQSWAATPHAAKGLDCEACHGNGADYWPARVMRDPEAARAAGLVMPGVTLCKRCHAQADASLLPKAHAHKAR